MSKGFSVNKPKIEIPEGKNFRLYCGLYCQFKIICDACQPRGPKQVPICICLTPYPKDLCKRAEALNKVMEKYGFDRESR